MSDVAKRTLPVWRRLALGLALPVVLAGVGTYVWVTGGRYVSTDNAYIKQDKVAVAPEVQGLVTNVHVGESMRVKRGDVLFEIDAQPYRIALAQAEAAIATARLNVERMRADLSQKRAELADAEQEQDFRQRDHDRQAKLAQNGYAAQSKLDETRNQLRSAEQGVAKARQGVAAALADLGGDPGIATDSHPTVMQALAARDRAALDLDRTIVRAPADGVTSQTDRLRVGQFALPGLSMLSLVETQATYVEANVKETDLTHMQPGQTATIELDAYPGRTLTAKITSIGAGTGSEFSILPAQNATGNWVKVVQRVPVRLELAEGEKVPLRAGLSANVEIDTGHSRGLPGFATARAAGR
ncbi:HlyD family secretion protein [Niveispirillum sp.]|uniref:HlyD family secretion protein n=1 Tax=Niveispirillum sp. TaxID=1917217 RepID=UPI0025FCDAF7|nr:HlyD family secretion protein [Niveispirillum sp.]